MATEEYSIGYDAGYQDGWNAAIDEKPKQEQGEPVAWMLEQGPHVEFEHMDYHDGVEWTPLYTTPQQRTWVGLDEEDDIDWEEGGSLRDLVEAVEAKLKEKNT